VASGRRRAARVAAALAALAGVVNLVSALLPAEADRLQVLDALVPGIVSEGATVITAAAGIGLLLLGQREVDLFADYTSFTQAQELIG
jgi:lysylphosphatidylglycerol synthetase-like protein (DUF2156 family)